MKKILILSANPDDTDRLRLDREVREIEKALARSNGKIECIAKWAVTVDDLRYALLQYQPTIVHFSGHGAGSYGLVLENASGQKHFVSTSSLAELFEFFKDTIECVFFNACFSEIQAEAIHQHIGYTIGMQKEIGDTAAIAFAVGFYEALSAGRSYSEAYRFGCNAIALHGIPESKTPVLKVKPRSPKSQVPENGAWQCAYTLDGHSDEVLSVAISPDGQTIASGSKDKLIKLWDLNSGQLLSTIEGHCSAVLSLAFSPDGKTLASTSNMEFESGTIKLWDISTGKQKQTFGVATIALQTHCVAFSRDGLTIASGHIDAAIRVRHINSGKIQHTLRGHGWDVNCVAFSQDNRLLVSGSVDGAVMIWNWQTGDRIRTLNRPSDFFGSVVAWLDRSVGSIWSVDISPDGKYIVSAGTDQPIVLWNTETGKLERTFTEHSSKVNSVVFSPNGKILASGGDDNKIRVWNVQTGQVLQTLKHERAVNSLAFSPDGRVLISGSSDAKVKIWRQRTI